VKRNRSVLCGLVLLSAVAAARGQDYVPTTVLGELGLQKLWQLPLPLAPDQVVAQAFLVDDQLYVATDDGYIYAINAPTGTIRWMRKVTPTGYLLKRPTHLDGQVLFATTHSVAAYERVYGDGDFRRHVDFGITTNVVADGGGSLYVGGGNGFVYAFDYATRMQRWRARTGVAITGNMTLDDGTLYFATTDGRIFAISAFGKVAQWRDWPEVPGGAEAGPVVTADAVYQGALDRSLYRFRRSDGRLVWRARLSTPVHEPPLVFPDAIYQVTDGDGLVSINPAADREDRLLEWKVMDAKAFLSRDDERVFALAPNRVLVIDRADGSVDATIPAPGFTIAIPYVDPTRLLLLDEQGRIFAAGPKDVPIPTRTDVARATGPTDGAAEDRRAAADAAVAAADDVLIPDDAARPVIGGRSQATRDFQAQQEN
jgi:hypothetical protein